ncbi:MAG: methylglyoxal synthase [candidate division WOR-3 bacterium]|nr:MAG: methylglyoxal synthase [candidate division WOR-3 bacterium]
MAEKPLIVMSASPPTGDDPKTMVPKRREICEFLYRHRGALKGKFRLLATKGLADWVAGGYKNVAGEGEFGDVYRELSQWEFKGTAYSGQTGGVVELANKVVSNQSKLVLFFISNTDRTGINSPANQALARICDFKNVPIYFNTTSATFWASCVDSGTVTPEKDYAPGTDEVRCSAGDLADSIPTHIDPHAICATPEGSLTKFGPTVDIAHRTLALISHDELKTSMRNFVLFFERTLREFDRIIATGTTGSQIKELAPLLRSKIMCYESGPEGGDIRIAFEILAGTCHDVVFFMDPLRTHPHAADIRVLTMACNETGANLITNRNTARDWVARLSREAC